MDGWLWASNHANSEINLYTYYQVHSDVTCILCQPCACATWPKISFPHCLANFCRIEKLSLVLYSYVVKNTLDIPENYTFTDDKGKHGHLPWWRRRWHWPWRRECSPRTSTRRYSRCSPDYTSFWKVFLQFWRFKWNRYKKKVLSFILDLILPDFGREFSEISSVWLTRHCLYWEGIYPTYNIYRLSHIWLTLLFLETLLHGFRYLSVVS